MSLNRSTLYYEPKGESEENLQLMRRLGEKFLETPYYGSATPMAKRTIERSSTPISRGEKMPAIQEPF